MEARITLDLRLGAAFTRLQTLALQREVDQIKESGVVSYGAILSSLLDLRVLTMSGGTYARSLSISNIGFCGSQVSAGPGFCV